MFRRASLPAFAAWEAVLPRGLQDQLIQSCRMVFGYKKNPSFWVGAFSRTQTLLDRFALDVFWFHVARLQLSKNDVKAYGRTAGAEFWVQRRRADQPLHERGMDWHFDKDEELEDQEDIVVTPVVGTVTYLSSSGAPLVVLSQPTLCRTGFGLDLCENEGLVAYVTKPVLGRHVAFDGGLLHGCPAKLADEGERLSLLVNVWLEHRPICVSSTASHSALMRAGALLDEAVCANQGTAFDAGHSLRLEEQRAEGAVAAGARQLAVDFGPWRVNGICVPPELQLGQKNENSQSPGPWALHHQCGDVCLELPEALAPPRQSKKTRRQHSRGLRTRQAGF